MADPILGIVGGAIVGAIYGTVGYAKNVKREDFITEFNPTTFLSTVIGSAIIGGMAVQFDITPDALSATAFGGVVGTFVTQFVKKLISLARGSGKK